MKLMSTEEIMKSDFSNVEKILITYLNKKIFSGCGLGFFSLNEECENNHFFYAGKRIKDVDYAIVDKRVFFDLASLTKPLMTLLSILVLVRMGKVDFFDRVEDLLDAGVGEDKKDIRLYHLIGHRSGLPAHRPYFETIIRKENVPNPGFIQSLILNEDLQCEIGQYLYSDLDYILLGLIIEKLSKMRLSSFWKKYVVAPLGLDNDFYCFNDSVSDKSLFLETGICGWSKTLLKGKVHDDNCRSMGRMMGHAGLFATLNGTLNLVKNIMLQISGEWQHPNIFCKDLQYLVQRREETHWSLGFDVPTGKRPSCGRYFSRETIGHLGFTGTSFWLDLLNKIGVVLLTNRVYCNTKKEDMRYMRSCIHDCVMEEILKKNCR